MYCDEALCAKAEKQVETPLLTGNPLESKEENVMLADVALVDRYTTLEVDDKLDVAILTKATPASLMQVAKMVPAAGNLLVVVNTE